MNTKNLFQYLTYFKIQIKQDIATLWLQNRFFFQKKRITVAIYTIIDQTEITFSIESCTAQRISMRSSAIAY